MGESVEIRLVLPWQAEGLLYNKILLFLPCQEPRGITEPSSLRHSTAGRGFPVAAHRSRTFSPSWTTIGLEGCGPPKPGNNNVNSHVRNANELVQVLAIQLVKETAACTWSVVHYGVHEIAPLFAVVNLLTPCSPSHHVSLRQRSTNFQKFGEPSYSYGRQKGDMNQQTNKY